MASYTPECAQAASQSLQSHKIGIDICALSKLTFFDPLNQAPRLLTDGSQHLDIHVCITSMTELLVASAVQAA